MTSRRTLFKGLLGLVAVAAAPPILALPAGKAAADGVVWLEESTMPSPEHFGLLYRRLAVYPGYGPVYICVVVDEHLWKKDLQYTALVRDDMRLGLERHVRRRT